MERVILASCDAYETKVAILEDEKLVQIFFAREDLKVGSIYKGKVMTVLPGMQAAFVNIGLNKNAFLCADDALTDFKEVELEEHKKPSIRDLVKRGSEILVQMIKGELAEKGARVTSCITLPGRYMVLLPSVSYIGVSRKIEPLKEKDRLKKLAKKIRPEKFGLIIRTAAKRKEFSTLKRELDSLLKLWEKIQGEGRQKKAPALVYQELPLISKVVRDFFTTQVKTFIVDSQSEYEKVKELLAILAPNLSKRIQLYTDAVPLFSAYGVEAELERVLKNRVWLDSGGSLVIDKTEALTVVDVNTGKYTGTDNFEKTVLKTNLEAADELARQLRLRDIGGIIVVDFIDMAERRNQKLLLERLRKAFSPDPVKTQVLGITELGLVQLTRKRTGKDLDANLRAPCPCCGGRGRVLSPETMRIKVLKELEYFCREVASPDILLEVTPALGIELLGFQAEEFKMLESKLEKKIYLRVREDFAPERFSLETLKSKDLEAKIELLSPGEELVLKFKEAHPLNVQQAVSLYQENLVLIPQGGDLIGQKVKVKISEVSRHFAKAEIVK